MAKLAKAVLDEMVQAMENLGAKGDLLSIVCSFKNIVPDEQILADLRYGNKVKAPNDRKCIS